MTLYTILKEARVYRGTGLKSSNLRLPLCIPAYRQFLIYGRNLTDSGAVDEMSNLFPGLRRESNLRIVSIRDHLVASALTDEII